MKGYTLKRKHIALCALLSLACSSSMRSENISQLAIQSIGELVNIFKTRIEQFIDLKKTNGDSCAKHVALFTHELQTFKANKLERLKTHTNQSSLEEKITTISLTLLSDFFENLEKVCAIMKAHENCKEGMTLGNALRPYLIKLASNEKFKELYDVLYEIESLLDSNSAMKKTVNNARATIKQAQVVQNQLIKTPASTLWIRFNRRLKCSKG